MNPLVLSQILQFGMQAILQLPELIQAGRDARELLDATGRAIKTMVNENRGPTAEEWKAMNDMIAALRSELHSPL